MNSLADGRGISCVFNCKKRKGTHVLGDQNGVSSGLERKEREIRTDCEVIACNDGVTCGL